MNYIKKSDDGIKENVLQIINTMIKNKVDLFYKKSGWDPFDPSYLSRYEKELKITDEKFWELCFTSIFYAGFKAQTVDDKYEDLCECFGDFDKVANFTEEEIKGLLSNRKIIRHESKIRAIVDNAKTFLSVIKDYGSGEKYLLSFSVPLIQQNDNDVTKLENLKHDLRDKFKRFGPATTDHFLQRVGFDVLKADIIIRRLFYRLGITEKMLSTSEEDEKIAREISAYIANLMGIPVTSIDRLFHWFGREKGAEICTDKPKCDLCLVSPKCKRSDLIA